MGKRERVMADGVTSGDGLLAVIADEETVTGFLLAGVGDIAPNKKKNFMTVTSKTSVAEIDTFFQELLHREDVAVILISQFVADMIRFSVNAFTKPVPAILEIPSKDMPYDAAKDSVLQRVKHMFSSG